MKLESRHLAAAWYEALKQTQPAHWQDVSQRLLRHLYTHGQLKLLPVVVREMTRLEHEHNDTTPVTVRSAQALPQPVVTAVLAKLLPQTQVVIEYVQDPSLLGGVQVETTNQRWDLSLRGQLRQLTHALA